MVRGIEQDPGVPMTISSWRRGRDGGRGRWSVGRALAEDVLVEPVDPLLEAMASVARTRDVMEA
jgi:hypothetical protein